MQQSRFITSGGEGFAPFICTPALDQFAAAVATCATPNMDGATALDHFYRHTAEWGQEEHDITRFLFCSKEAFRCSLEPLVAHHIGELQGSRILKRFM